MKRTTMIKPLIAASLLAGSIGVTADSFIRVINNSTQQLQAIWQAGGCGKTVSDWDGDEQWTVCDEKTVFPGDDVKYNFNWILSDRSVKVFHTVGDRVGYCNSMDSSSLLFIDDPSVATGLKVIENCD